MHNSVTDNRRHEALNLVRQTMADLERQLEALLLPAEPNGPGTHQKRHDAGKGSQNGFKVSDHFADYPDFSIRAAQAVVDRMRELAGSHRLSITPYDWKGQLRGVRFAPNSVFIEYIYSGRSKSKETPEQGIKVSFARKPEFYGTVWPFRLGERQGYTHVIVQKEEQLSALLRMVDMAWGFKKEGRAPRVTAAA
ncbi:MAG: hypothetical protein HN919_09235 [Verrucomicrobia bacterium]|jgi:hypothetical protein|nr:hypothetical protein [Verrucomicrobiota bacterium]